MRGLIVSIIALTGVGYVVSTASADVVAPPRTTPPPYPLPRPEPRPEPPPYPQPYTQDGLCRRAPVLAQLAPEQQNNANQQGSRWSPRSGSATLPSVPPVEMMAPPAPVATPDAAPRSRTDRDVGRASEAAASVTAAPGRGGMAERRVAPPTTSSMPPLPPAPPPPPRRTARQQQIQSGQLTAGEHDDLLNPALYARYVNQFLAGETLQGVPRVDTGKALSIIVQDSRGAPVPFAQVTLRCSDGNTLSLTSMADGRVVFFPDLDRLGQSVTMTAELGQQRASMPRTINVGDVRGAQEVRTQLSVQPQRVGKFDLAVVIDATGSMGDEIEFLKAELADILTTLRRRHKGLDIRVAMVVYRDQGDEFVTRTFEFTSDMGTVQRNLSAQSAGGGGDTPEAMEVAMARAVGLNWRQDAVKSMLLVADAPPHSDDVAATWAATEVARAKRIQIVPVAASGVDDAAQYIMRAMAAATQSRYAFLTDDSGIGNPHAEPSVDCYHVTKLDSLVRRILDAQISGRRIEPENNEIVRTVGDYDRGKCRGA
jgi:Mg-chelatase subunit ChlD